jgi:hypothetical protein
MSMRSSSRSALFIGLGMLAASGCVHLDPPPTPEEIAIIEEHVSLDPPEVEHPLDIEFERGVRLLGYRVQQAPAAGGEPVDVETVATSRPFTITWYWQVTEDLDSDFLLFTHAFSSAQRRQNVDHAGVLRRGDLYQPGDWQPGQYIRDVQEISLENWDGGDELTLYIGIYQGEQRLGVVTGDSDGEGRARAVTLPAQG